MSQQLRQILFTDVIGGGDRPAAVPNVPDEIERVRLAVTALFELMVGRSGIAPEEVRDALYRADLLRREPPMRCPACSQPVDYLQRSCAFCRAEIARPAKASDLPPPPPSGQLVVIKRAGSTSFLDGERVDAAVVEWENAKAIVAGASIARTEPVSPPPRDR
jgi:hypothetical protein